MVVQLSDSYPRRKETKPDMPAPDTRSENTVLGKIRWGFIVCRLLWSIPKVSRCRATSSITLTEQTVLSNVHQEWLKKNR